MHPGLTTWRLSKGGEDSIGLSCTKDGIFLGRTPLLEKAGGQYRVRGQRDLERLLAAAYGAWYSTPNIRYGGKSPREFLRGKSWKEQYEFGLQTLRDFGVLK